MCVCVRVCVCVCVWVGWGVMVIRESGKNKKKTENKKGWNEKSVFLFSFSALCPAKQSAGAALRIHHCYSLWGECQSQDCCTSVLACPSICACARVFVGVRVSHTLHSLSVKEQRLYISCTYRYHRSSQPCQSHWSLTERKKSTLTHFKGTAPGTRWHR